MNAPAHFAHVIGSLINRSVREHVDTVAFSYWESFKLLRVYLTILAYVKGKKCLFDAHFYGGILYTHSFPSSFLPN
jgi:hypothetical protein